MSAELFCKCEFCGTVVTQRDWPHLFLAGGSNDDENAYALKCAECRRPACSTCLMAAYFANPADQTSNLCMRCRPDEWAERHYYCVQYVVSFVDRRSSQFSRTFFVPQFFTTMSDALSFAIGSHIPDALRNNAEPDLAEAILRACEAQWMNAQCSAAPNGMLGVSPVYSLAVPRVTTPESAASVVFYVTSICR